METGRPKIGDGVQSFYKGAFVTGNVVSVSKAKTKNGCIIPEQVKLITETHTIKVPLYSVLLLDKPVKQFRKFADYARQLTMKERERLIGMEVKWDNGKYTGIIVSAKRIRVRVRSAREKECWLHWSVLQTLQGDHILSGIQNRKRKRAPPTVTFKKLLELAEAAEQARLAES